MRNTDKHPAVTFLKPFYQFCDGGSIELRLISESGHVIQKFIRLPEINSVPPILEAHRDRNCYFGVATRRDGDGSKDGIVQIPALWVDLDLYKLTDDQKQESRQRYKDFPLRAAFIINSGGGRYLLWMLKEPASRAEIPQLEDRLKRLASYFHADMAATDASRILRMPGSLNHKYQHTPQVKIIESNPEKEYSLHDFESILPEIEEPSYQPGENQRQYDRGRTQRLNEIMECAFMKHCDRDRGTLSEPEWYAMVSILAKEKEGPNLIHSLSSGYPKYSVQETDKKIIHAINDTGPATCERIKRELWDCGKDCGVKSPVVLSAREKQDDSKNRSNHTSEEWPAPVSFDEYSSLPDFPTDALQSIGREIVEAVSEVNQVDPALTACFYLGVLSACCAKKATIDLKSHKEPPNLYLCPVYDSGNRKSSTDNAMTKPLYEFQKARQEEMEPAIWDAQNTLKIREKRLEKMQKKAAEEEDPAHRQEFENEASKIALELAKTPIQKSPIFLVDDVTPEKLGVLMAENRERMAIITPEGGLFEIMAGRYSNDGVGNFDLFLKAHAGDFWSNHRVGREAKTMQAPALTLCLAVQSEVIEEVGKNRHFRGRGLLARFLYARCKSQVGYRQRQTISIPAPLTERYRKHVFSLMDIPFTETILELSQEAQRVWDEFYNDIEKEMRSDGSLYLLRDWGSKLPGAVARMAGLFHFAEHGVKALSLPISVNLITASSVIGAYFKEHALAAFGLMQEDRKIKLARQILDYIQRKKPESFKGKDVIYHTAIKLMEDVDQGLKVLLDRGYVRVEEPAKVEGPPKRGRPGADSYRPHPDILKGRNV